MASAAVYNPPVIRRWPLVGLSEELQLIAEATRTRRRPAPAASLEWWADDPAACLFDPERCIALAWVHATEGATSQAISILRKAAADAAAQAVVAHQRAGLRGAALSASVVAARLAAECQRALTPALRAVVMPKPFTGRQQEVIALVAQGLSNKEIADRLTMSVRSVEGHLFRASQRVGVNGRDELAALLRGV